MNWTTHSQHPDTASTRKAVAELVGRLVHEHLETPWGDRRSRRSGRVVLISAPPGTGKTTAARVAVEVAADQDDTPAHIVPTAVLRTENHEHYKRATRYITRVNKPKTARNCDRIELVRSADIICEGGGHQVCLACPHYHYNKEPADCSDTPCTVHEARRRGKGRINISTHAHWAGAPYTNSRLVVVDESPLFTAINNIAVTRSQLERAQSDGVLCIHPHTFEAMATSETLDKGFSLAALALRHGCAPANLIGAGIDSSAAADAIQRALTMEPESGVAHLGGFIPNQALKTLQAASGGLWEGIMFRRGQILVPALKPLPAPRPGQLFLWLDATSDMRAALALWPDAEIEGHLFTQKPPGGLRVIHVPYATGSPRQTDGAGAWAVHRAGALTTLVHKTADSPKTLHVTVSRWLRAAQDVDGPGRLFANLEGPVIHHNGTKARGTNEFEAHSASVCGAYKVPSHALVTLARVLESNAGCRGGDVDWMRVARAQLVDAPSTQAAHRIRGIKATPDTPVDIWWLCDTPPRDPMLRDSVIGVDPDALWWLANGRVGIGALPHIVSALLRIEGGHWCPVLCPYPEDEMEPVRVEMARALGIEHYLDRLRSVGATIPGGGRGLTLAAALKLVGHDWSNVAKLAGVKLRRTQHNGMSVAVLCDGSAPILEAPVSWGDRVLCAFLALRAQGAKPTQRSMCVQLGVTSRAAYNRTPNFMAMIKRWSTSLGKAPTPALTPPQLEDTPEAHALRTFTEHLPGATRYALAQTSPGDWRGVFAACGVGAPAKP